MRQFQQYRYGMAMAFALGISLCQAAWAAAQDADVAAAMAELRTADQRLQQGQWQAAAEPARRAAELAPQSPDILQRAAEVLYRSGLAAESLPLFERVVSLVPEEAAYNWQRGIALGTCGQFAAGAKQFETHHSVNPDDVENSAWYFLCIAKSQGLAAARKTVIPSRGDGRQPMMSILQMLQERLTPDEVLQAAEENATAGAPRRRAQFYAALYVGLYYDALGDGPAAQRYLQQSLGYGDSGYMVDVARVYLAHRFPPPAKSQPAAAKSQPAAAKSQPAAAKSQPAAGE